MSRACSCCRHWQHKPTADVGVINRPVNGLLYDQAGLPIQDKRVGLCRRFPPPDDARGSTTDMPGLWPVTWAADWCGEWSE